MFGASNNIELSSTENFADISYEEAGTSKLSSEKENSNCIAVDHQHQQNNQQRQQSSFLRWINPFNSSNININQVRATKQVASSSPIISPTSIKSFTSSTVSESEIPSTDEYRGVAGLRQFWNNRITEVKQKSATLAGIYSKRSTSSISIESNPLNPSKSTDCILSAVNSDVTSKRSISFRENFENNSPEKSPSHQDTDNFYKYKTAATKKRSSLSSASDYIFARSTTDRPIKIIPAKCNSYGINFPAVSATASGEKIHWPKREDIFMSRRQYTKCLDSMQVNKHNGDMKQNDPAAESRLIVTVNKGQERNCDETITMAIRSSPQRTMKTAVLSSPKREPAEQTPTKRVSADKTDSTVISSLSPSNCASLQSLSSDSPVHSKATSSSAVRKYSFKTHAKNYHSPRKMAATNSGGSKVAALTHRFNQLIQQDSAILEEVKRNNGILLSKSGHVYKIKDCKNELMSSKKKLSGRRTTSDDDSLSMKGSTSSGTTIKSKRSSVSKKNSFSSKANNQKPPIRETRSSSNRGVKAFIDIFETKHDKNDNNCSTTKTEIPENRNVPVKRNECLKKPKIPSKSEQVLQRTKEITVRKNQKLKILSPKASNKISTDELECQIPSNKVLIEIKEEDKICTLPETKSLLPENIEEISPTPLELQDDSIKEFELSSNPDITEQETQKSKYARLYEKFRFRSPFSGPKKPNSPSSCKSPPDKILPEPVVISKPEQKIVDALETVNRKLEHLSKSTNDIAEKTPKSADDDDRTYQEMKISMKPNESFLFRKNSKNATSNSGTSINESDVIEESSVCFVEAVNVRLINKTQSMDETRFPSMQLRQISLEERSSSNIFQNADELLKSFTENDSDIYHDDTYEPISKDDIADLSEIIAIVENSNTFLYKSLRKNSSNRNEVIKSEEHSDVNNIYQTVAEAKNINNFYTAEDRDCDSHNSYESYQNYESVADNDIVSSQQISMEKRLDSTLASKHQTEDGYEICDPPEPPPPRKFSLTNNEIALELQPALPTPKRNPNTAKKIIEYSKIPPRPPKSPRQDSAVNRTCLPEIPKESSLSPSHCITSLHQATDYDEEHDYDGENIYDTIKHSGETISHCYESITSKKSPKSLDTVSIVSNCYESISSLRRGFNPMQHAESISTLASDQKTNSLYGITLDHHPITPTNGSSASDNSDEWIDISDQDEDDTEDSSKHQFIVVREPKLKCHRSPVWTERVRDQRLHQHQTDLYDDDSDHYYEPLNTIEQSEKNFSSATLEESESSQDLIKNHRNSVPLLPAENNSNAINKHQSHLNQHNQHQQRQHDQQNHQSSNPGNCYSDEYDSFDSADDTDDEIKKKTDSGVDISNTRLPDPPQPTNQVYAFVKKIKNFSSLSKSLSKISKRKSSSPCTTAKTTPDHTASRPYENTKFYVDHEYQNTPFTNGNQTNKSTKQRTPKVLKKKSQSHDDPYENTEFHTPRTPVIVNPSDAVDPSASSPYTPITKIDKSLQSSETPESDTVIRKISKSGKSFKSKFRKTISGPTDSNLNIGNSLNGTRSTFYISDSVDLDSGIFEKVTPTIESNVLAPSTTELVEEKPITPIRKNKKSLSSPELNRRRTTIGMRPTNPPPPPPIIDKKVKGRRATTTSWYAECGVFKANSITDEILLKDGRKERSNSTSWYAEAGLYQTSGASVASSSGSSGVSTGGECCPGDDGSHSMFDNEPLYQIYSAAKLESISRDIEDQESTDGYEEIGQNSKCKEDVSEKKPMRPSALQLVGPKNGPSRTLWSEIPEVINSEILSTLTPTEKRLQEAKFEILTSEASYLKSLNLLKSHFMNHPAFRDTAILSSSDRKTLFSLLVPVNECSDRLLSDLENCWQDNIMLLGLSKSIFKHAEKYFHVYVSFCEHQGKMDRTLRRLKELKGVFAQNLEMLEQDPVCYGLNLHSFLMLPMQRITRLPLLIDAVFSKVKIDDDEYDDWKMTLAILNKIVAQCNEAANRCEQAYEIERISRQMEFPSSIRALAIAPFGVAVPGKKPRSLVKKGELTHLIWRGEDGKLTFGKKFVKCNIYVFLFTDLLVLTKRKSEEQFTVFDYCPRSMLNVTSGEVIPQLPTKEIASAGKNLILMTLLENHEGKTIEMILSCPSVSEQQRWLQATTPPESENPDEKLYEQWDCPQVIAKHEYQATEPDLLSLEPGDVVNVTRKMTDGWYEGERIRDGASGWFPGSYTEEVNSPHVRARNLKQRYRLLTLTANYLETLKKNNLKT